MFLRWGTVLVPIQASLLFDFTQLRTVNNNKKLQYFLVLSQSNSHTISNRANWRSPTTLTKVFPCFFFSCKANARLYLAKMGHGPHAS